MKQIVLMLVVALFTFFVGQSLVYAGMSNPDEIFCQEDEIRLNTDIPFVGRCIKKSVNANSQGDTTIANAFGLLLGGMMRILMTAVLVIAFLSVLIGGFLYAMGGWKESMATKGKALIIKVIIGLILLGASGIILNLINPNFFGTSS